MSGPRRKLSPRREEGQPIGPEIASRHVTVPIRLNWQAQGPGRTGYDRPLAAPALEYARF